MAEETFSRGFVFDNGIIPCVFDVVLLRPEQEEALEILSNFVPRREGIWCSVTLLKKAEEMLGISKLEVRRCLKDNRTSPWHGYRHLGLQRSQCPYSTERISKRVLTQLKKAIPGSLRRGEIRENYVFGQGKMSAEIRTVGRSSCGCTKKYLYIKKNASLTLVASALVSLIQRIDAIPTPVHRNLRAMLPLNGKKNPRNPIVHHLYEAISKLVPQTTWLVPASLVA
jgi:hypothetical protein